MNDKLRVTIKIADVEPIHFEIDRDEEIVYRKAEYHVNKLWSEWRQANKNKSSQEVLARVALAFAELYYRKSNQLVFGHIDAHRLGGDPVVTDRHDRTPRPGMDKIQYDK